MRNFLCEATGANCTNPRCKLGSCFIEQEAVRLDAARVVINRKKNGDGAKAGRARMLDPAHARRAALDTIRDMTKGQIHDRDSIKALIRERLESDKEFLRMLWAVPEVRTEYRKLLEAKTDKATGV